MCRTLQVFGDFLEIIPLFEKCINQIDSHLIEQFDSWWHHLLKSKTILIPDFFQNSGIFLFLEQVKPIGMRININMIPFCN